VLRGWQEGREYPLDKPAVVLGRAEQADIALFRDMKVEKRHAIIRREGEQYVLVNQNNEWVLEDQPAEKLKQEAVDLFVSRVINLPAELRVTRREGPLAPYGLTHPAAEITATAKDGKRRSRMALGTSVGGLVYATGQGLPGIYQARADLLTQIPVKSELLAKAGQATSPVP